MMAERGWSSSIEISPNCPRCGSCNTKFCYYNNYSLTQPRYFCKGCKRYWTKGGSLRNVPVDGGCRKSRRGRSLRISTSTHSSRVFRETQCSSSSSFGIDIAQVYANYLNQTHDNMERRIKISTPQPANDSCHISNPSSYMQTDFSSWLVPLQMEYEVFNRFTNLHQVVDDLPPLPGEEALQISTAGWENELIFENAPQLATIELDQVPLSEDNLVTYCKSSIDGSSYDTFSRS